jgi:Protein of unknown function (DUF2852)
MTSAANQDAYAPPGWNSGPWGNTQGQQWQQPRGGNAWPNQPWAGPPFWHPAGISRPMAIFFTVLGFIFWWPVGLAMLFYMIGSGRMGCMGRRARGMNQQNWQDAGPWANWKSWACGPSSSNRSSSSSGNRAFDEYKAETLRRLEEGQREFGSFLDRLRFAKDKAEFDQFMAERRSRPSAPPTDEQPAT